MEHTVAQDWEAIMVALAVVFSVLSLIISCGSLAGVIFLLAERRNSSGRSVENAFAEAASSGYTTRQSTNPAIFDSSEQPIPDFITPKIKSAPLPQGGFGRKV